MSADQEDAEHKGHSQDNTQNTTTTTAADNNKEGPGEKASTKDWPRTSRLMAKVSATAELTGRTTSPPDPHTTRPADCTSKGNMASGSGSGECPTLMPTATPV